jgi:5'-3' exonuclease
MINFIEQEIKPHLTEDGILYLLFDPISLSDLGESKNFTVPLNNRKKILADYKEGRSYSPLYLDSIELFRKYYIYRGDHIKLLYSDEFEADDYAEPLLEQFDKEWSFDSAGRNIAIISTDYDFAKYILNTNGRKVHLINGPFDKPVTVDQFESLFQFKPTIAANTVYKALFGDKSDHIVGALFIKKAKFNTNIKTIARDYIQYVSNNKLTLQDVIQQFKNANFMQINAKQQKTEFDMLYLSMSIVDLKIPILEKFFTNIRVIRSALAGKNVDTFTHCNQEQPKINDIVHQSIFGAKFTTLFGKV